MSIARKIPLAVVAVGGLMMVGAGTAVADNHATAVGFNSPGFLSGAPVATVASEPLNNCANHTPAGASVLSGTAGNLCLIN
ncbi:hypothetical protein SAMN05216223_1412 [Actinacidiphila yanglinensis]|uniref:Chaplin domain-containing protein n=1 Tax=Actinacidiphila yanglinensis TaxID=310779 RepID=A0A1H6EEG1_9ACTN|nr:chaplin [Actinacidiphila yanglinensis]SEG96197.1 hypothetical protein SAMN05216223_1412 [Actinacidiphila yanglinensis]